MPKSDRDYMKKRVGQLQNNLDRCLYHLGEMRAKYHPNYPEQTAIVENMAFVIVELKDFIDQFRREQV